eukprot:1136717-Pelagomonas_calceolata.AAC.3
MSQQDVLRNTRHQTESTSQLSLGSLRGMRQQGDPSRLACLAGKSNGTYRGESQEHKVATWETKALPVCTFFKLAGKLKGCGGSSHQSICMPLLINMSPHEHEYECVALKHAHTPPRGKAGQGGCRMNAGREVAVKDSTIMLSLTCPMHRGAA